MIKLFKVITRIRHFLNLHIVNNFQIFRNICHQHSRQMFTCLLFILTHSTDKPLQRILI